MPVLRILFFLLISFSSSTAQVGAKKVVFIIADGIPADLIEKSPVPGLREIAGTRGYARLHVGGEKGNYSQTPTISAVSYNSLLTGTWVNKHNVWDNDIRDPNYQYPTIFWYLKRDRPLSRIGVYSTWTPNRTALVGDSLNFTNQLKVDYRADGYELDTIRFPHDQNDYYIHEIDDLVAEKAAASIKRDAPDLSWVYLQYTDDIAHQFGDGPQFENAIALLDKQIDMIWQSVEYRKRQYGEDWLLIVTTDHGRDSHGGRNHGGQSERERSTWIFTNAGNLNRYFYSNQASIVDILPTIVNFLGIKIPRQWLAELDGVSLVGDLSMVRPAARLKGDSIALSWEPLEKSGKVKIWLSPTNNFMHGGKDEYRLIGESPLRSGSYRFSIQKIPSSFYKILLEGPHNFLNQWVILKEIN